MIKKSQNVRFFLYLLLSMLLAAPALYAQYNLLADPLVLHEESLSNYYAYIWEDPALFPDDIFIQAKLASPQPLLYSAILFLFAKFKAVSLFFFLLPILSLLLTFYFACKTANHLGGKAVCLFCGVVILYLPTYYFQIAPALPHSLAFPLLAASLYASTRENIYALAFLTVLTAGLYAPITPIIGLLLAWHSLMPTITGRQQPLRLSYVKRYILVSFIAIACCVIVAHSLQPASPDLGVPIKAFERVDEFPENGLSGKHFWGEIRPISYIMFRHFYNFDIGVTSLHRAPPISSFVMYLTITITFLALIPFIYCYKANSAARALLPFFIVSLCVSAVFLIFFKHLAYRFPFYSFYTVFPISLGLGVQILLKQSERMAQFMPYAMVACALIIGLNAAYKNPLMSGYYNIHKNEEQRLFDFIQSTPKDSLFAGFPEPGQVQEAVPLAARRSIFVHFKMFSPNYDLYTLNVRKRLNANIDAYFAADWAPVKALYSKFGVDYLIVDTRHLNEKEDTHNTYFAPYKSRIDKRREEAKKAAFILSQKPQNENWLAFHSEHIYVLDLSKL